ncbi:MAG: diphosphate--fructose-6-phosphate 1-phosphotransferase [Candidatus Bipolaricaulota bacterium]|nr:diphosphate--fructose-6-phosphate 1-phosphotransferase [Candidatus Bipolaricaulota bacterium]
MKNVVIAQSGGPTAVINSSLLGVVEACRNFSERFGRVYAAYHGIEGVLKEELLDLSVQSEQEFKLLRTTPAAGAIGTCRYKIKPEQTEDLERIVEVFRAHRIGFFFYIGGNDSMDTAQQVSELAQKSGLDLVCVGVPKTIDNDLGDQAFELIDHTPGYGSTARYWAHMIQNLNEENRGSCRSDPVLVVQAMGRRIGFIPAAARLADPKREMPLQIYLPEAKSTLPELAENVNQELRHTGRVIVVVSEGFDVGNLGESRDSFGHTQFSASEMSVAQVVVNYLNRNGFAVRGAARGQIPGTDQRNAIVYASTVDLEEAYCVGRQAVRIAVTDGTGYMATIRREPGPDYTVSYDKAPLGEMANSERVFPKEWIAPSGIDVTDEFLRYARPLIGEIGPSIPLVDGLQRFVRLKPFFAEKKCPAYIPSEYR